MKRLIVGVDPGVTVGLAVLSLDGQPVLIESRRGWSLSEIVKMISELGEPTIISSDVSPASEILEQLSHKLNAVLFVPSISMGADEKRQIARDYADFYGLKLKNAHEADALAAAVKAYKHYERKFEHVEARVRSMSLKVSAEDVKDLVVRGYSMKRAIQHLQGIDKYAAPVVVKRPVPREEKLKNLIEELQNRLAKERERLKHLRQTNRKLQARIKTLEAEILSLKETIKEIQSKQSIEVRREREYSLLMDELEKTRAKVKEYSMKLEEYKRRFNDMQRLRELESQGRLILLKPIEAFTDRGLQKAFQLYGIRAGDSVLLLDPSGGGAATAEELAKRGVKTVVTEGQMSHNALEIFEKYMIPVVSHEDLKIEWVEGLPYVDSEGLREAIKKAGKKEALTVYRQIKTILEEHRREIAEEN
ncbi:hypothetical protein DRO22_02105 [Candidatus Bathyarchaeota archaeon]|nr:MAG: hypothetical protein DRO22_02105 [Candidatus Bathyarchaeota archaeon]